MSIPGSIENGSIDTEFTPILHAIDGKYCAADERFASVNEAIGLLQYNAEQDSERISDLLVRVEKLEAAQPIPQISRWPAAAHPPEGDWAHIPAAEWEAICAELEALRNENETYRAENAAQRMERDAYKAKWESVPWEAIEYCINVADRLAPNPQTVQAYNWHAANAPKEAAE